MGFYHRVHAQIDLDCIINNYKQIQKHLGEKNKIIGVLKADGYGHGAIPIAKELQKEGIYGFGVAVLQEAITLRKYGISVPIIVLGYTTNYEYADLIKYNIVQTVFNIDMANEISKVAVKSNKIAKIHIKLDTGMGRLGFIPCEKSLKEVETIYSLPNIEIEGIFTHFSKADESCKEYTHKQIVVFNEFIQKLEDKGIHIDFKHAANSAGIIDVRESHYNMTRCGIALYGLYPSEEVEKTNVELKPALSLISSLTHVKEVDKGTYISYGGTYITQEKSIIGTIPVGYGDGYPRSMSSKGRVLIKGDYAPIIGRVCMDQLMVDVTNINNVKEGDEVVLIGKQNDNYISVEEIAEIMGTINYEVVCQLGKRIPRIYLKEGQAVYSIDYL